MQIRPTGVGDLSSLVLKPVERLGCWRVELAWPHHPRRYFGNFSSEAEAEKWIKQHDWLTKQRRNPEVTPEETGDGE